MKTLSLNGPWRLDVVARDGSPVFENVPATVPGSVYHDLLTAGMIPDPFYRDNENEALKLMEHHFVYTRVVDIPQALLDCDQVVLRCDGLDTLARVKIVGDDGESVRFSFPPNMHRAWELPLVTRKPDGKREANVSAGPNTVTVTFESPTRFIRQAYAESRADGSSDAMQGFPLLRKAHCMFGWDWGPRLPDAGIWRDITVVGYETARLDDVVVRQKHGKGVTVTVTPSVQRFADGTLEIEVALVAPDGQRLTQTVQPGQTAKFAVDNPRLWWPNGYGEQPLYTVDVTLRRDGAELDRWTRRIGLRTVTVRREKDQWGESFCFNVNGTDIFAMGADYIPEDNLLPRVTPQRTRRLLEDAAAAHMNTIRVWGGGYYPDDFFFDSCDELGLLVWQDFMFACAVYNLDYDGFEDNVRAEFIQNVRRLRDHASLALWCGNNEMETFTESGEWVACKRQTADYIKLFEYIIPKLLEKEDPDRFYWPSSPSSGGSFDNPGDPNRGDVHYWNVWHGMKPFTDYRNHLFRFVSEFGFQSFPCMATIEAFTLPEDRNVFSYVMEKHQRNASANGKIAEYLAQMYRYPAGLDGFVYASQLLQAQAMQYGVEHWRRHRGECMGAVIWQLNDCWPVASWSSIDYYGRWKALHYYEKRFFAPVLISCHEEGILSQNTNVNAEGFVPSKSARLNVSNETRQDFDGIARWALRRPDASVIREGSFEVHVPALSAVWLDELDCNDQDTYGCYFSYELEDKQGRRIGGASGPFCAPKHFRFEDPQLEARIEGDEVVVTAKAYARSVELQCGADVLLDDNFFDMNAGTRRVKILRGTPEAVSARSVYNIR